MSTHVNDLASAVKVSTALAPVVRTTAVNGSAVDLISADGACFAIQQVGALSGATWSGSIQESDNGTSWSGIDGAEFTPVDAANDTQTISFRRTKRYVRYAGAVDGGTPSVAVSALIGEQWKTF